MGRLATTVDSLDVGPVNVTGVFRANKARVIYSDGRLHIFQTATRHVDYETDPPLEEAGVYTAQLSDGSGELRFSRQGCSTCGYSLGRIPADQLLSVVVG